MPQFARAGGALCAGGPTWDGLRILKSCCVSTRVSVSVFARIWQRHTQGCFVKKPQDVDVAILLATYNGARFVEQQIRSLKDNDIKFTLHWLDDHSVDNTRETVRAAARSGDIELKEWHQPQHLGVPGAFFRLLECVEADVYLFCDQDDIWQPDKIDVTVGELLPDLELPVICFSDLWRSGTTSLEISIEC